MSREREISDQELRDQLRGLRIDPPDAGFEAKLHRRLVEQSPAAAGGARAWLRRLGVRHRPWFWVSASAAACAVLFLLRLQGAPAILPGLGASAAVKIRSTEVAVVRVDLTADVAVEQAEIRVTLPEGLAFWSEGRRMEERSFEWTQPLTAGSNEIPIAVRGERPGRYYVKLTARVGDARIEHEVPLKVIDG